MINALFRFAFRSAHRLLRAYWSLRRPATRGALIAVWHEGRILLALNSYRNFYSLPGGYVRPGEYPKLAAQRELLEELAMEVEADALRHAYHGTKNFEFRRDTVDIFELRVSEAPSYRVDDREVIWAEFTSPEDALELPLVPHLEEYLAGKLGAGSGTGSADAG